MRALAHVLMVVLMGSPAGTRPALTVTLRETAVVDAGPVTLADVAEMTGELAGLAARLGAIELGPAPDPGMERAVTRSYLLSRLRQERVDASRLTWTGATLTRVSRRCSRLPGAAIGRAAADELRKTLPWPDEDIVIEVQRAPADVHILGTAADLRYAVAVRPGQRLLGSVPVTVTISRDGQAVGRATAVLQVRVFQPMVTARRRIRRGEVVTKDMVRLQRAELTSLSSNVATDLASVLGREARYDIQAFGLLTGRALAAARVIRRGALVTLMARRGRMRVTTIGIALEDAAVADWIRVQNRDSQKIIRGQVIDSKTVEVPF